MQLETKKLFKISGSETCQLWVLYVKSLRQIPSCPTLVVCENRVTQFRYKYVKAIVHLERDINLLFNTCTSIGKKF